MFRLERSINWEAKFSRINRIPFKSLAPHQEEKLLEGERGVAWKFPDTGPMRKMFDGTAIYNGLPIFVAIYFNDNKSTIIEIPFRSFLKEKYESGEKSLTKQRASEIGKLIKL